MIDLVFEYLEASGVVFYSQEEMKMAEEGIRAYLDDNGIPADETRGYFRTFLQRKLQLIDPADLKAYFLHQKAISLVGQIRIEQAQADGALEPERAVLLRKALTELYRAGLGERYVPTEEQTRTEGGVV